MRIHQIAMVSLGMVVPKNHTYRRFKEVFNFKKDNF